MATTAADGIVSMGLVLFHGNKKINITVTLPAAEEGDRLLVKHLANQVQQLTEVPVDKQKLIFKGRSLNDQNALLADVGISQGCKIMLVGRKPVLEMTKEQKELQVISDAYTNLNKKLSDVTYQMDGLQRGFVPKTNAPELCKMLNKQLMTVTEGYVKMLESLDAIEIPADNEKCRSDRKNLVVNIQKSLENCDSLSRGAAELFSLTN